MRGIFPNLVRLLVVLAIVAGLSAAASAPMLGAVALTITPSSAAAGTTVLLQGSGFTPGGYLKSVAFGSVAAPITMSSTTITAGGSINVTIVVPPLNPAKYTVVAKDNYGVVKSTSWTVAAPTVGLSPESGPTGTLLAVTGSGWIPTTNTVNYSLTSTVAVTIGGQPFTAPVSGAGTFKLSALVPPGLTAGANSVVITELVASSNNWAPSPTSFTAVASFNLTLATITLSTALGASGQSIKFTGAGFPPYSQINSIIFNLPTGTPITITPVPESQTDGSGNVAGTFVVPDSIAGVCLVVVRSGNAAGAATFTVTATSPAATPAAVFESLITNHQLAKPVWSFDNVSKTWKMYDPNDLADSTITLLKPGANYWICINTASVNLNWGINSYSLTSTSANCWNGIGWMG